MKCNRTLHKVLRTAYKRDFVDNMDYSIKTLDKFWKKGFLTNKHLSQDKRRIVFWSSQKGVNYYHKCEGDLK